MQIILFQCKKCARKFELEAGLTRSGVEKIVKEQQVRGPDIQRAADRKTAESFDHLFRDLSNHAKDCRGEVCYTSVAFVD